MSKREIIDAVREKARFEGVYDKYEEGLAENAVYRIARALYETADWASISTMLFRLDMEEEFAVQMSK